MTLRLSPDYHDADGEVYSLSRWLGVKTNELKARFGGFSEFPGVDEAVASLSRDASEQAPNATYQRNLKEHDVKVALLVTRQRQERSVPTETQEIRRISEIKFRQDQLPSGLKAAWA